MKKSDKSLLADLEKGKPSDDWKFLLVTDLGWKVYGLLDNETGYYQFKSFATVPFSPNVIINTMTPFFTLSELVHDRD